MTADHPEDSHQRWNVRLRLAIDADNADEARVIAEQVWRTMEVTAGAEPQITRSDGRTPHWNVITDLDLSALESITPDDAVTRFRYVIRNLPGVVSSGTGADDRRSGLWQWLPGERSRKRAIYLGSSQTECTYVFRPHACHMLGWLVRVPCC